LDTDITEGLPLVTVDGVAMRMNVGSDEVVIGGVTVIVTAELGVCCDATPALFTHDARYVIDPSKLAKVGVTSIVPLVLLFHPVVFVILQLVASLDEVSVNVTVSPCVIAVLEADKVTVGAVLSWVPATVMVTDFETGEPLPAHVRV
jgi:hypothetical protein